MEKLQISLRVVGDCDKVVPYPLYSSYLVMEGLSLLLKESQNAGILTGISVSRSIKILHILFVDDVVILTKATMQEWWEIDKILKFFCLTSGLQINIVKSTFHHAGLTELDLNVFKVVFPFKFIDGPGF
jgi:hypothetical protein